MPEGGWVFVGFVITTTIAIVAIFASLLPYQHGLLLKQLGDPTDRTRIRKRLSTDAGIGRRFSDGLGGLLDQVDRYFGPPFGWCAFDRCLLHAYLYPIALFVIAWGAGASGALGSVDILASAEVWERLWRAFLFIAAPAVIITLTKRKLPLSGRPHFVEIAAFIVAVVVALAVSVFASGAFNGTGTIVIAVGFIFAFAFSFERTRARSGAYIILFAFVIAFSSAFFFSGPFGGPGAIIAAVISADPVVLTQPGGPLIVVVSASTAVILIFYVALPIANAALDWVSWIITRWLLRRPADGARSGRLALGIGARLFFDLGFAFASLCLLALVVPNAIELSNRLFARLTLPEVAWLPFLDQATKAPFSEGFFVTGMLLTTLLPTLMHVVAGLFGVFAVWTLGAREMVALIPTDGTDSMPPSDQQRVAWFMIRRRLWLVPAIFACLPLVAVLAYAVTFFTGPIGLFLADLALCGSSWSHGICPVGI